MPDFSNVLSIKSKIGVEYRRYALRMRDLENFEKFYKKIEEFHHLQDMPFSVFYMDIDDFFLPINNDDNLAKAIKSAKHIALIDGLQHNNNNNNSSNSFYPTQIKRPYLKLFIEKRGVVLENYNGSMGRKSKKSFKGLSHFVAPASSEQNARPYIGTPEDFRQVSSIIDVDSVPKTCRRVRIVKHGSDKPLGFYIRDGTYWRRGANGHPELVVGVFISKLVPGGLAESTGLLAVNDEVIEVNGIQVMDGKTLDQVTDMMVANSSNLIMTIRPGRVTSYVS